MSKQSEKLVAAFQTVADENRQETAKKIFAAELLKARNRRPLSGSALDARVGKLLAEASEEVLEKAARVLGVTLKPEEFSFPISQECKRRLSCEEAGECLGLCASTDKDDETAAQADALAVAAEKGAKTVGEVLPEEALGDVDPETPIVVVPEPEPELLVFEGRTYTVALTERGLLFTSTCGKTKEVLDAFCRWWQKATRRPITGAEGLFKAGNEELMRLLVANRNFLQIGAPRKPTPPPPTPAPVVQQPVIEIETTPAPESATTPAAEPAKNKETIMTETNARDLARAAEDARKYLTEMRKRFHWAETSTNFTNEKLVRQLVSLFSISETEAFDLVVESRKNNNPAPVEAPITEEKPVSQPQQPTAPVSQPQQQPAPEAPKPATKAEVEAALSELKARYAHTPCSKKVGNTRKETLTSIEAKIKKGEFGKAMGKIQAAFAIVPVVEAKPVNVAGTIVVEMAAPPKPIIPVGVMNAPSAERIIDVTVTHPDGPGLTDDLLADSEEVKAAKQGATIVNIGLIEPKSTPAPERATIEPVVEPASSKKEEPVKEQTETTTEAKAPEVTAPVTTEPKKPGMWQRCVAWAQRFDRRIHFKCGPTKEPEGMEKIPGIIAQATKGVKEGEFVSSTGTGPGIIVLRQASEVIENAMAEARKEARMNFPVKDQMGTELTLGQLQAMSKTRPELEEVVGQASAEFRRQWELGVAKAVPSIVEKPVNEYLSGKEEGVNRGLILAALIEAFHMRNPVKRDEGWKLDPKVVQAATEGVKEENAEKVAKATAKILNGGGSTEAKAMLRAMEAATVHLGEIGGKTLPSMESMENMLKEIPDVVLAGSLITTTKVAVCTGNEFPGIDTEMVVNSLADCAMAKEFEGLFEAIECQEIAHPNIVGRVDSLAGMGDGNLAMERAARIYCLTAGAHNLIAQEGGPEFVRLMVKIRSAKKVEQIEKIKGGRGVMRKVAWSIYVAGKWTVLAVVAVVSWAFLPAKVVFYAGKAAAYKVASLFAGKDEGKKAERNAAAGEAWACCVNSAKAIVMRPYGWAKRIVVGGYNKIKGWFGKSADQQTNGTAQAANNKKEGTMGLFTGVLSQKFGEAKGTEFGAQKWYHKAASIAMSPFVAAWRVTKTYTAEVVVAAASAGIAVIVGASALVVGGVAVAGAAVGMAARWIGRKFFGKKDETTTTAPAATAPAQQAAA